MEQKYINDPNNNALNRRYIPDELVIEILSRLAPLKLGQCSCVSKLWNSSVTVEAFLLRHIRSSCPPDVASFIIRYCYVPKQPCYSYRLVSFNIVDMGFKMKKTARKIGNDTLLPNFLSKFDRVSNTCLGLVCFYKHYSSLTPSELSVVYSVRTNDLITLPKTTDFDVLNYTIKSDSLVGFDDSRKKYVILRISLIETTDQNYKTCYETLTLGTSNKWNRITNDDKVNVSSSRALRLDNMQEFCLDGVMYWISGSKAVGYVVSSFDLNSSEFRTFDVGKILGEESTLDPVKWYCLVQMSGCPTLMVAQSGFYKVFSLSDHKKSNATWDIVAVCKIYLPLYDYGITQGRFLTKISTMRSYYSGRDMVSFRVKFIDTKNEISCSEFFVEFKAKI